MGEVWLATNVSLDLPVAIKLLRTKDAVDPDGHPTLTAALEEHLLHEAQATAKLSHPAIVRVFDFGLTTLGDPFIVMERLEGEDLRDRLARSGPMLPEASVQLLLPVIHAMHTAHLRGIVHRDLKPENIFLATDDGGRISPKVVDFGIAELPWLTDVADLVIAGTPAYMAPEQAAGHPNADHRVDIWAVCVALYEMIAGTPPFLPAEVDESFEPSMPSRRPKAETRHEVYANRAAQRRGRSERNVQKDASGPRAAMPMTSPPLFDKEPTPLGPDQGADEALWAIVLRGLAPVPSKRWRSMRDLGEALAEWLFARGIEEDVRGISLRARWLYEARSRSLLLTPTPPPVAVVAESQQPPDSSDAPADARAESASSSQTDEVTASKLPSDPARARSGVVPRGDGDRVKALLDAEEPPTTRKSRKSSQRAKKAAPLEKDADGVSASDLTPPRPSLIESSKRRGRQIPRWIMLASLAFAASVGAVVLKLSEVPPAPQVRKALASTVELVALQAERSVLARPAASAPSAPSATPSSTPRASHSDVRRTESSAEPKPRHTTHPPAGDSASQVYPDSP